MSDPQSSRFEKIMRKLDWFRRRKPKSPDDPHAYVTAPKKPRLPHLSSAAVAELPDKQ